MDKQLTTISFPFFGIEVDPGRALEIGSFSIYYYGIIIGIGLILALLYGWKRSKEFGLKSDDLTDGLLWIAPFAVICARAYYCIFQWEAEFAADPVRVFYIWEGGLAIFGGVIGAVVGVCVYCYFKKLKMPAVLDILVLGLLIGQAIGRWGNFFNREAYGVETDFFLKMGLFQNADRTYSDVMKYYHPTFLYESVWNALGFVLLHFLSKKRQYDGQIALCYGVWYGFGRYFIEPLRTDSLMEGSVRVSQVLAGVLCVVCAVVLAVMAFRKTDRAKLYVNQVAAAEETIAAEAAVAAEEEEKAYDEEELEEDEVLNEVKED